MSTTTTKPNPEVAGYTFQRVIVPRQMKEVAAVTVAVSKPKNAARGLRISISAALASKAKMVAGQEWGLYVDAGKRVLQIVRESDGSSRKCALVSTRIRVEFPHRPLAKILPERLPSTPARLIMAGDGKIVFELPAEG